MKKYFILPIALACSACGGSGLYPVSGSVRHNGQPAVGATVTFLRKGESPREPVAQGVVGESGAFELAGPAGPGAPPGEYIVLVEWKEGAGQHKGRSPALSAPDRLKNRYLGPNNPLLTATVEAKRTKLAPFELE